ncbi:hypothetical protein ACLB2K_032819 [Fragaria x ananassa]
MDSDGARDLFQAQTHLYKHIFNFASSMSLKCAVQLGIPDVIDTHGEPITLPDLVTALQLHPDKTGYVQRLMRLMVHSVFFATIHVCRNQDEEEEEEAYDLTPSSRLLLKDKIPILELPQVVANLQDSANLKFIAGDMFNAIPPADAILLKLTLHALSDEECLKVLKKCREAIPDNGKGKVIIIDIVINKERDEHESTEAKFFFDMLMMVLVTGRERSEKEWEKLFLEAGFSKYKITPIFGLRSLIEIYP